MADAKKCDRCGKFYIQRRDADPSASIELKFYNSHICTTRYLDLCPDCFESFTNWRDKKEDGDHE